MAHVFTCANAKGGCGKTTVTLNLAICFSVGFLGNSGHPGYAAIAPFA
jgi:hypothetical protein